MKKIPQEEPEKDQTNPNPFLNGIMKSKGIQIAGNPESKILDITLEDILNAISEVSALQWKVLFLEGVSNKNEVSCVHEFEKQVNDSEQGVFIQWNDMYALSARYYQMYEAVFLGSEDVRKLKRYKEESEMWEACEMVIILIDCVFWEVYSKDSSIIKKLETAFKNVKLLD